MVLWNCSKDMHRRVDRRVEEPRYGTVWERVMWKKDVEIVSFELGAASGVPASFYVMLAAIPRD